MQYSVDLNIFVSIYFSYFSNRGSNYLWDKLIRKIERAGDHGRKTVRLQQRQGLHFFRQTVIKVYFEDGQVVGASGNYHSSLFAGPGFSRERSDCFELQKID